MTINYTTSVQSFNNIIDATQFHLHSKSFLFVLSLTCSSVHAETKTPCEKRHLKFTNTIKISIEEENNNIHAQTDKTAQNHVTQMSFVYQFLFRFFI